MKIIERVLFCLENKGHTMADLCSYIGVSTSTVANWKTRGTDPPAKLIHPICEFLDVSYAYILIGKEELVENDFEKLTEEHKKILGYYDRLGEENKDFITGEMVRLYREEGVKRGEELSLTLEPLDENA